MSAFTVRLDDGISGKLDRLTEKLDRSRAWIAQKAIEEFVAREYWQIDEIEAAVREADHGDFAADDAASKLVSKFAVAGK